MRIRLAPALLILALPHVAEAQTRVSRSLPLNPDGGVRIHALVGTVTVRGWDRDSVTIRGSLGAGNRLHAGGGRAGVKMFVESENDLSPAASTLEIMVPARAKLWIKTATADVRVAGVTGSIDVYVISGAIDITGRAADINAEAIDGTILIRGTPGWLRAKSASGAVSFWGTSRDVTLSTVSGRIVVDGDANPRGVFERGRFESVTGDISFRGGIERGADLRFDTHAGAVDVTLPQRGADLEVTTISGTIQNGASPARPLAGRYGRGAELKTTVGDGGAGVSIRTFRGAINIRRAK
ncbi:MAG TPA: hypothetical protein VMY38_08535 [Gemmatimonadaceae bacterium]|nr:hypothetical protein [Gemmatimonadaceae bacterium]